MIEIVVNENSVVADATDFSTYLARALKRTAKFKLSLTRQPKLFLSRLLGSVDISPKADEIGEIFVAHSASYGKCVA